MLISNHLYFLLSGDFYDVVIPTSRHCTLFVMQCRRRLRFDYEDDEFFGASTSNLAKFTTIFFVVAYIRMQNMNILSCCVYPLTHSCVFYYNSPITVDILIFFLVLTIKSICSCYIGISTSF